MKEFDKQMEMVLYHSDEGDVSVEAYIKGESLWITQKAMAEQKASFWTTTDLSRVKLHLARTTSANFLKEFALFGQVNEEYGSRLLIYLLNVV